MSSTVLVNDFVNNERFYVTLGPKEDKKLEEYWFKSDQLLDEISHTPIFKGLKTWNQLRPSHYQILILRNFVHLDRLTVIEKQDVMHPVLQSLYFLIACLIRSLLEHSESDIEYLKLTRLTKDRLNFDYHASITIEIEPVESSLKVVVDNTKLE
jgi:hypothetical protein